MASSWRRGGFLGLLGFFCFSRAAIAIASFAHHFLLWCWNKIWRIRELRRVCRGVSIPQFSTIVIVRLRRKERRRTALTPGFDSSTVQTWLRKRAPRKTKRRPSREAWIVSAGRSWCSMAPKSRRASRNRTSTPSAARASPASAVQRASAACAPRVVFCVLTQIPLILTAAMLTARPTFWFVPERPWCIKFCVPKIDSVESQLKHASSNHRYLVI